MLPHVVEPDARGRLGAPERRRRDGNIGPHMGADDTVMRALAQLFQHRPPALGLFQPFVRAVNNLVNKAVVGLGIDQLIDGFKPFKRVLAVKNAGLVGLAFHEQNPLAILPIDRRAADDNRELQPTALKLLHTQRHLLGRTDQQRAQADSVGVDFNRLFDDCVERHLLTQIVDGVAIVRQNGVDQIFADIVYIAVDRRQHDLALGRACLLVEVLLQVAHRLFHDLGGLQHERQDQLTRAKLIADFLHCRQQHVVQDRNRGNAPRRAILHPCRQRRINVGVDRFLFAVNNLPVNALLNRQALGWIGPLVFFGGYGVFVELNKARQRIVATVEDQVLADLALLSRHIGIGRNMRRIDDGRVQAGFDRVIQKDRVERAPRVRRNAKAEVRDAKRGEAAGNMLLDRANALDCLNSGPLELFLARSNRKG